MWYKECQDCRNCVFDHDDLSVVGCNIAYKLTDEDWDEVDETGCCRFFIRPYQQQQQATA